MMVVKLKHFIKQIGAHHFVFLAFLALNAAVLYSVPLFGDDYYYGSFIKKGLSFFVTENVVHYVKTNGRAVVHLLDQLLLYNGTNYLWKIFNLVSLGFAVYFTAATINLSTKTKKHFGQSLIIVCCLTGLLELGIVRQSLYWATGSMNYLFPYALFITYYYLLRRDALNNTNAPYLWILGFFTGFSAEQAGFAAIFATVMIIIYNSVKHKNPNQPQLYTNLIAAGAGYALQIFAPGNAMRTTHYPEFYAKSVIGRITENAKPLYKIIFGADGIYLFVLIAMLCVVFELIKKMRTNQKPISAIFYTSTAILVVITSYFYIKAIKFDRLILTELNFLVLFSLSLLSIAVFFIIRAVKRSDFDNLFFLALAPILQLAMLLSPQYGPRTLLISAFCLFIPLSSILLEKLKNPIFIAIAIIITALFVPEPLFILTVAAVLGIIAIIWLTIKKASPLKAVQVAMFVVFVCLSFSHIAKNAYGYYQNLETHNKNKAAVQQYLKNGGEKITLYVLPNPDFKYTMPYDDPYHLYWYKIINDLPENTEIVFIELN